MLRSIAHGLLAVAEWLRGRLGEAEHAFAASIAGWRAASQPTVTAWGGYQLSQVQRARGNLYAAAETCRGALEIAESGRSPGPGSRSRWPGSGRPHWPPR